MLFRKSTLLWAAAFFWLLAGEFHTCAATSNDGAAPNPASVMVAAIQCSSVLGDVTKNTRKLSALVQQAAKKGAKIIVMPEAAITGYLSQDLRTNWHLPGRPLETVFQGISPNDVAVTVPGATTKHFAELSKNLDVYLTVAFLEKCVGTNGATNYFNSVCLVSRQGKMVAHYRKLTPWPHPEKSWATAGDRGIQFFDTEYGRVGLAICYDIHTILEKYQPYHLWALLYPIAWVDENHPAEWFWHSLPARLAKFDHYLIGANWSVDASQPWHGYGFSEIISPKGDVIAAAHSLYGSEIVYATIPISAAIPADPGKGRATKSK